MVNHWLNKKIVGRRVNPTNDFSSNGRESNDFLGFLPTQCHSDQRGENEFKIVGKIKSLEDNRENHWLTKTVGKFTGKPLVNESLVGKSLAHKSLDRKSLVHKSLDRKSLVDKPLVIESIIVGTINRW